MPNEIKIGDVVVLKSGGPDMVVQSVYQNPSNVPTARCSWFDRENRAFSETFSVASLKVVDPDERSLIK